MSKIIQYLYQDQQLIPMFLKEEICLVGLNEQEEQAIIDVLSENFKATGNIFWG